MIKQIITKENQRNTWLSIKRVINEPRLGAITKVEKNTEDGIVEIHDLDGMVAEIQQVTEKRFELAESAPASTTSLRTSVGFLADTQFALDLLSGTTDLPTDLDDPTRTILEEMKLLWNDDSNKRFATFSITKEDFRYYWKRAKESTSSSISNVHFGHYKTAARSDIISRFLADKLTVIGSYGCPPTRWGNGLQVMLEKVAGVALVEKLWAILLMEIITSSTNGCLALRQWIGCTSKNTFQMISTARKKVPQKMLDLIADSLTIFLVNFVFLWLLYQSTLINAMIGLTTSS